jgi:hypothetical protein
MGRSAGGRRRERESESTEQARVVRGSAAGVRIVAGQPQWRVSPRSSRV